MADRHQLSRLLDLGVIRAESAAGGRPSRRVINTLYEALPDCRRCGCL